MTLLERLHRVRRRRQASSSVTTSKLDGSGCPYGLHAPDLDLRDAGSSRYSTCATRARLRTRVPAPRRSSRQSAARPREQHQELDQKYVPAPASPSSARGRSPVTECDPRAPAVRRRRGSPRPPAGRRAVDEDDDLLIGLVAHLQRRHRLHGEPHRRGRDRLVRVVAEQHRQRPRDDDKHFLPARRRGTCGRSSAAGIATGVRASAQAGCGGEVGRAPGLLASSTAVRRTRDRRQEDPLDRQRGDRRTRARDYGARVLLVVAATEPGAALVDGAGTLVCGIGPVEAALATAARDRRRSRLRSSSSASPAPGRWRRLDRARVEAVYCDVDRPARMDPARRTRPGRPGLLATARRACPMRMCCRSARPAASAAVQGARSRRWRDSASCAPQRSPECRRSRCGRSRTPLTEARP